MKTIITVFTLMTYFNAFTGNAQFTLNGFATYLGNSVYQITPGTSTGVQQGSMYNNSTIDLSQPFYMQCEMNFGSVTAQNGGDGMAFVLQREGITALRGGGGYLGLANYTVPHYGVVPSLFVEFDTFNNIPNGFPDIAEDHIAIARDGDFYTTPLAGPVQANAAGETEDGIFHKVEVLWNPQSQLLSVYFDYIPVLSLTNDIITNIFGGVSTGIYWGFSGGSANAINDQRIGYISLSPDLPTGISQENDLTGTRIYYNAAGDEIIVSFEKKLHHTLELRNVLGDILFSSDDYSSKTNVDMSRLPKAIYIVTVTGGQNDSVTKKIVKM